MESILTAYHEMPRQRFIAREGYPFIGIALVAFFVARLSGSAAGQVILLLLAGFTAFFFRNPERRVPQEPGLVVSPADGRVIRVEKNAHVPCDGRAATRVSIFMSVFSVHVNRLPVAGRVKRIVYHAGRFFVASLDKASEHNERNGVVIEDEAGREFVMIQIAGLIARRIICYLKEGDRMGRGERMGLIRFGSRVDLYLPPEVNVELAVGNRVRAGETVVGRCA